MLLELAVSDLRNADGVVKDGLAYCLLLHVLEILLEEEVAHILIAFVNRRPVLDHDVALGKRTAERYGQ